MVTGGGVCRWKFVDSEVLDLAFALLHQHCAAQGKRVVVSASELGKPQTPWDVQEGYQLVTAHISRVHASVVHIDATRREINLVDGLGLHTEREVRAQIQRRYSLRGGQGRGVAPESELWLAGVPGPARRCTRTRSMIGT